MNFEIERTEALMMMERINVENSMCAHYKIGDMRGYEIAKKLSDAIGTELSFRLKERGCDYDLELHPEMGALAKALWMAHNDLKLYIQFHSFEFRDFLERHKLDGSTQLGAPAAAGTSAEDDRS